ncbi:MAG: 50S ribosomal protein L4 [Bacilli bacterium]|nr:50S ribosomal protein L4 [Bacilli bacterium]
MAAAKVSVSVVNLAGEEVKKLNLDASVFGIKEANEQAVHDAVIAYQANLRQATAKTKKRHEVSGGGKKPYRQKGTGRARAGSSRSPIWVGGGKVFGPDGNQNYTVYQNKKAHALALKTVLSQKVENGLVVVDKLDTKKISTKAMVGNFAALKVEGKILLVTNDENTYKSAKNISKVVVRPTNNVSVYDVLNAKYLVVGEAEIKEIEEALK